MAYFKKVTILWAVLAVVSNASLAATIDTQKKEVFNVMKRYADVVACGHSFDKNSDFPKTTLKHIYPITQDKFSQNYYVLWGGDKGCLGGSGTTSYYMSEVGRNFMSNPFYVRSDNAFGDLTGINFHFIESVKQISSEHFEIIAWDRADDIYGGVDQGSNFPANKFKYTVKIVIGKGWKVTNQALLEQHK